MLISFSGLPGVGKSTVARLLAERLGATILRIDVVEQALRDAGLAIVEDEGYRACYALAEDNLRLGRTVIADCVNDVNVTREAWRNVALRAGAAFKNVDVICSDADEHRRRIETRTVAIPGLVLPTWAQVSARAVEPWLLQDRLVIDTAKVSAEEAAQCLEAALRGA